MERQEGSKQRTGRRGRAFREGLRDGLPIALGYFAVAFSLGITARNAGITPLQGFLISVLHHASAGEYAGITAIAAAAGYLEMALVTLIADARYLLMSAALTQKFSPETSLGHRVLVGFGITDELFGIAMARPASLDPFYSYGAMVIALPAWALGTTTGIVAGNTLPLRAVSALSVALYGMFLAIIIPPARKNKVIAVLVALGFAASWGAGVLPGISQLSGGTRTILLTLLLAGGAAALFPVPEEGEVDGYVG